MDVKDIFLFFIFFGNQDQPKYEASPSASNFGSCCWPGDRETRKLILYNSCFKSRNDLLEEEEHLNQVSSSGLRCVRHFPNALTSSHKTQ